MDTDNLHDDFLKMLNLSQGTIFRLCMLHTDRRPDSINDLYQAVVCNLWASYPKFRSDSKSNTWVYRVALNTARKHLRNQKHAPQFVQLDGCLCENIACSDSNPMVERLYQLIDFLDEDDKAVVTLYLDQVPLREIASILGTTETAVKHRMQRIKSKLKKMNEDERQ